MRYEILNDIGDVVNTIIADREFVEAEHPGKFRLIEEAPVPPTQADYTAALEAMYDAKAHERHYDNRFTCALRAGYVGPFQAEGTSFAQWMDACNATAYQIMAEVLGGQRPMPTIAGLLALMPELVWP